MLLLLAAGHEARSRPARAASARTLSFSLALTLLDAPHWDALSPLAPLRQWRWSNWRRRLPAHAPLAIDERVLHAITGVAAIDERLQAPW